MVAAFIETPLVGRPAPSSRPAAGWRPVLLPGGAGERGPATRRGVDPEGRHARPDLGTVALRPVTAVDFRRRRTVAAGVVFTILLGLFIGLQVLLGRSGGGPLAAAGSTGSVQPAVARLWIVHPGDTLWTIALDSGAGGDIRPLVARLSAEVHGQPIQPGERILVP